MATLAIGSAARRARAPFTALLASIVVLAGGALGAGAATIALTMLRLAQGQQAAAGPPTVRTVYLVIDAVLLVRPATTRGASEPRSDLARQPQPA